MIVKAILKTLDYNNFEFINGNRDCVNDNDDIDDKDDKQEMINRLINDT